MGIRIKKKHSMGLALDSIFSLRTGALAFEAMDNTKELQQMQGVKILYRPTGSGSANLTTAKDRENIYSSITSQLGRFLPPRNENKQLDHFLLPCNENKRLDYSLPPCNENKRLETLQDRVTTEMRPGAKVASYCNGNVTLTAQSLHKTVPTKDITLASLLGYPITKSSIENQQSATAPATTTATACRARLVGKQQSLAGFESRPNNCMLYTEPVCSTIDKNAFDRDTLDKSDTPLIGQINPTLIHFDQKIGNECDLLLEVTNTSDESDCSESSPWWMNPENDISMADAHKAVSDFLTGKSDSPTKMIKEELITTNVSSNSSNLESNCLESTCSKIINKASMFGRAVGTDDAVSTALNESCILGSGQRQNLPVYLFGDERNTLGRPNVNKTTGSKYHSLCPPTVDNRWVDRYCIRDGAMYRCNICDKIYSQLEMVRDDVRTHLGIRPYVCYEPYCKEAFTSQYTFNRHLRNCHGTTSNKSRRPIPVLCIENDNRSFTLVTNGSRPTSGLTNVKSNTNTNVSTSFPCPKCGKEYKRAWFLKEHEIVAHSNITPYRCESCGEHFHTNYARYRHFMKTCFYKDRLPHSFNNAQTTPDVIKVKKIVKKRFQCKECDQKFTKERFLTDHVCYGEGKALYACEICSDTFVQRSYLIRHLRKHTSL